MTLMACGPQEESQKNQDGNDDINIQEDEIKSSEISSFQDALYIKEGQAIPPCDSEGRLIYVQKESVFKACFSGSWTPVEVSNNNQPMSVTDVYSCYDKGENRKIVLDNEEVRFIVDYRVTEFSDGTYQAQIRVGSQSRGLIWSETWEQSTLNFPEKKLFGDVLGQPNNAYWEVSMSPKLNSVQVNYIDQDLSDHGIYSFVVDKEYCTKN
ncbi:MAG: hypothetical protein VKL39_13720 [Leptolyngbyaceae bacterium]|nr:hypothetical protein [Leptolyngbyaceae bacterium]